ncbi:monocarboxylate transporter 13-like isoform X3 [Corythoichthys intestinalis]|uniref:monocarboxylate transporter 13-like isoform X3 n=1 Tax=Corythoichthys intestinalis TaxID=161448 RepID=UPI0025A59B92|nr:monocarboxylate transporter 13-like isoform X3 [Corythoichthys intestinalis]XP_057711442.1 monocarboxylate transporter 13-like isoform X3 [Corythoichthys intestinalis]XP_057711443.1 monocarboxylate transporter 13-like isoform X3 [Corythoichthys intestinalis]XP_057711444.1 monocarboxylate transporter 13-like isoform X3 [Corythoichthys intestinalis]XP_061810624.1 monocarboxylate transporter 13 [Nerophis lumbriciformis]
MASVQAGAERRRGDAEAPDGGWGWVLVGALFVSTGLVFGLMRGLGIFFVEFVQYFEESAQAISWISSTGLAAQQFFSPLGAALSNAYGARPVVMAGGFLAGVGFVLASRATCLLHLYLSMGLISGLGWGLVFTPMVATVMASFTRRRTFALGLAFSGIGVASFTFNPLFQFLVETYAWRGALLILGSLSLNIVPCGALIRSRRRPKVQAKVEAESGRSCGGAIQRVASYLELSLLCERPYLTYTLAITLLNVGYFVPYVHLVAHSRHVGFSEYQAAFVTSAAGVTDILGRLVSGWFSDLGHFRLIHLLSAWTTLAGLFIALLPVSTLWGSYAGLVAVSLLYGFCSGALTSLAFTVVPTVTGPERVMGALGLLQLIESWAGLLGTPLSGLLRDVTGDYTASFMVSGSFLILGTLTMATLPHYFSCTDPPLSTPPDAEARRLSSETEQSNDFNR